MKQLMKCVVMSIALSVASATCVHATQHHHQSFNQGDKTVSLLLGYGEGFSQKVAFDYCLFDNWFNGKGSMGMGGAIGHCMDKHWNRLSAEITASLHYRFTNHLDTYIGIGAGGGYKWYETLYGEDKGFFSWSTYAGARWYFTHSFAVNIEAGYTFGSYILAGVSWRF